MIGDNASVISNAEKTDAALKKKHVALSYHFMRENVSLGVINPNKIDGKDNIAEMLTKPLDHNTFMHHINRVLWVSPIMSEELYLEEEYETV
jgi:hypothetical protein